MPHNWTLQEGFPLSFRNAAIVIAKKVIHFDSLLAKFVRMSLTCNKRSGGSCREHFMNSSATSSPIVCLKSLIMVSQKRKQKNEGNMNGKLSQRRDFKHSFHEFDCLLACSQDSLNRQLISAVL